MGMDIIVHHGNTLHEHVRMLSLDGAKVSEDSTVELCIDGDSTVLKKALRAIVLGQTKILRLWWCSGSSSGLGSPLQRGSISWCVIGIHTDMF
jgi:hypothetical protein